MVLPCINMNQPWVHMCPSHPEPPLASLPTISLWAVPKHHHSLGKSKNTSGSTFYTVLWLVTQSCLTLCDPMDCSPPGYSVHGDSPSKNTGVDYISYSKGSSQCRNQTQIFCIADGFFTVWATGQRYLKSNASSKQYCQTNFGEVKCASLEKSVPMDHRFCCSVIKSYVTLCTSMNCSTLGWPVLQYLPEFP